MENKYIVKSDEVIRKLFEVYVNIDIAGNAEFRLIDSDSNSVVVCTLNTDGSLFRDTITADNAERFGLRLNSDKEIIVDSEEEIIVDSEE